MIRFPRFIPKASILALGLAFPLGVLAQLQGESALSHGDSIVLIDAGGSLSGTPAGGSLSGTPGTLLSYTFDLVDNANPLIAVIPSISLSPNVIVGTFERNGDVSNASLVITEAPAPAALLFGAASLNGKVSNSRVTFKIPGVTVTEIYGGYTENGDATSNTVDARDTSLTVSNDVYGGYTLNGDATNNAVILDDGDSVAGTIFGGYTERGNAKYNRVILSGGSFHDVVGGWANDLAKTHEASSNLIFINGNVTIDGLLAAGYVNSGPDDKAIDNLIIIGGNPDLSNADIRPGYSPTPGPDVFSGNRLILEADETIEVRSVENVHRYSFILPAQTDSNNYVALKASSHITFGDGQGKNSVVDGVQIEGGGSNYAQKKWNLFQSTGTPLNLSALDMTGIPAQIGVTLLADMELDENGGIIRGSLKNLRAHPQAKALSEGYLSSVALLTRSADLIANKGLDAARDGHAGFAVIGGDYSRYKTGSRVDIDSFSLLAGLSGQFQIDPGTLTAGTFINYGDGSYDTQNSLGNHNIESEGKVKQTGAGLLARLDWTGTDAGHPYAETSLQFGRIKSDFKSSDLRYLNEFLVQPVVKYHTRSAYQSVHLGGGYVWKVNESAQLDLYGKYFYARRGGDTVRLETGDTVHFKAIESQRIRVGGRYVWTLANVKPYAGLAWEHEFDGRARASTYYDSHSHSIDAPSMKGDTGIVEFGLSFTPSATLPLSIDFGVQGYAGQRKGASGSVKVKYDF